MKRKQLIIVSVSLVLYFALSLFSVAEEKLTSENIIDLLTKEDTSIFLGDGRGEIGDVLADTKREKQPRISKKWKFTLEQIPKHAIITVHIFSLVRKGKWNCATTLKVNNAPKFDLREGQPVGTGQETFFQTKVDGQYFKQGNKNKLAILEEGCRHNNKSRNDSLIRAVRLELF